MPCLTHHPYSSTKCVFDNLGPQIVSGTVIMFDELMGYEGWEQHEYRALQEMGKPYEYLSVALHETPMPVTIRVK